MKNKISDRSTLMLLNRTSVILGALAITAVSLAVGYFLGYKSSSLSTVNESQTIIDSKTQLQPVTPPTPEVKNPDAPVLSLPQNEPKPILQPLKPVEEPKTSSEIIPQAKEPEQAAKTTQKPTALDTQDMPKNKQTQNNQTPKQPTTNAVDTNPKTTQPPTKTYTIQLGAFPQKEGAIELQNKLKAMGIKTYITTKTAKDPYYKVRTGSYKNKKDALNAAKQLQAKTGLPNFITTN